MGSYHTISLLYVIFYASTLNAQKLVNFDCEDLVTGIFNEDTKLQCTFNASNVNTFELIELSKCEKDGETLIFNATERDQEAQGRIKLLHPHSQDISLVIQKTQLSDGGEYQYYLETTSGHSNQYITLKVKAPYSLPKVTKYTKSTPMRITRLTCETTGYPQAQFHWFVNGNLTSESHNSTVETPQGLLKITSTLQIKEGASTLEGNYTCAVWNVEDRVYEVTNNLSNSVLGHFLNRDHKSEEKNEIVLIVVLVITGAILLVIASLVMFKFRRTRLPDRRQFEIPMMPSDQQADV
ncbi:programmed cell death 1 ligand 2-like isoform X2 [Heterodontus francisci]|uniref:programmed cell death 1 ligand 2-like isoform X2 n=1 Tax=Heterodontus francisci TaxID=7792 RepID=UPI00355C9B21